MKHHPDKNGGIETEEVLPTVPDPRAMASQEDTFTVVLVRTSLPPVLLVVPPTQSSPLIVFTCAVNAQSGNYNIYNYSAENGLPTNDYQYVYQDSYGFLWLASYDGLFRWDGYAYKKYYHEKGQKEE